MFKLLFLPFRLVIGFIKIAGAWGAVLFAVGIVVGMLIAPTSGAHLRAKVKAKVAEARQASGPPAGAGFAP